MSVVAFAQPAQTLAAAVDELVVLVRNRAGGSCVWCGSPDLWVDEPQGSGQSEGDCLVVTCRDCGAELLTERLPQTRGRCA